MVSTGRRRGPSPRLIQPLFLNGRGLLELEEGVVLGYFPSPHFLTSVCHIEARSPSASVVIGKDTVINNNFTAISENGRIQIGARNLIGPNVTIFDSDFHGLTLKERKDGFIRRGDVIIEDDVFIGAGVTILKGVHIGAASVIAAGSVVIRDVPRGTLAAGNPARVVKSLTHE